MRTAPVTTARTTEASLGREPRWPDGRWRRSHGPVPMPSVQIQITPLIDVLLVLLVLGVLAGSAAQTTRQASAQASGHPEVLMGLSLPLRSGGEASRPLTPSDDRLWVGLGPQGQLSWRGVPVTRDILTHQLHQALTPNRDAEVWLAVDQAVPYADLLSWLAWLQAQQVTHLTLLHRAPTPAPVSGKP